MLIQISFLFHADGYSGKPGVCRDPHSSEQSIRQIPHTASVAGGQTKDWRFSLPFKSCVCLWVYACERRCWRSPEGGMGFPLELDLQVVVSVQEDAGN